MQSFTNLILSKKQLKVLELFEAGLTTQQIASSVNMSELTIKIIIKKIKKLSNNAS